MPPKIILGGVVREWVGIGWLNTEEPPTAYGKRNYPVVIDG